MRATSARGPIMPGMTTQTGRAGFQSKYSTRQRDALVFAQCDRGMTAKSAAAAAAAGTLPAPFDDLEPFIVPVTTARDLAGDERRRRKSVEVAAAGPERALARAVAELVAMVNATVERQRKARGNRRPSPDDLARTARMVRETAQTIRAVERGASSSAKPDDTGGAGREDDDFLGGLAGAGE